MPLARLSSNALNKIASGGGSNFEVPSAWGGASYGSGWPIAPVSPPQDTEMPRSIDYPISVNSTLTPRSAYGIMPFAALLEVYENVAEVKNPVSLIWRELTNFIPRLVDDEDNEIEDHPYQWMTESPDRKTPFAVWMTRLLKSSKVYDAAAVYLHRDNSNSIDALQYIDGSTLFVIVDQYGNVPDAEPIDQYVKKLNTADQRTFVQSLRDRINSGKALPTMIPAYTQVIKGTPFAWWSEDQIWYMPQSRRMNSPYGESFIEQSWTWIMIIVNILAFELGHYRTGSMPEGFITLPPGLFPTIDRITAFEAAYNQRMTANPLTERMRLRMFPDGSTYTQTKKPEFPNDLYQVAWKNILHTIGIPPSEFGDIPGRGLGGTGFKEGAESDLGRNTLSPHRKFLASLFNYVLDQDGVDDARWELSPPLEEADPDKLRQRIYDGTAHGVLTLNDAQAQLGLNPIGDIHDPENVANKHLIVAGNTIYVVEDMDITATGLALPNLSPKAANQTGGDPLGPEAAVERDGKEHNPQQDAKTLQAAIKNMQANGTLDGKFYSVPARVKKADIASYDSAMVAIFIPETVGQQLRQMTEAIGLPADSELVLPNDMHLTLAFLPNASAAKQNAALIVDKVTDALIGYAGPLSGKIQGYGIFNGEDGKKVLFALYDEPSLPSIREAIVSRLPVSLTNGNAGIEVGMDHGFVPHITLAYFPETFELPAGFEVPDIPCQIESVCVAIGDVRFDVPFRGNAQKITLPSGLDKHCGLCEEDDEYFGAPIRREAQIDLPIGGHVNGVEIVAMCPPDLPCKTALWKPEGGEMGFLREGIDHQYPREEAAYLLDRSLGFRLVPLAYVAQTDDGEVGAVLYYSMGMGESYGDVRQYGSNWLERAAVLDYIMNNTDRGYSHNYGTHPDDPTRPILFYNGLTFPADDEYYYYSPFIQAWMDQGLSDEVVAAIIWCLGDAATWKDIQGLVGAGAVMKARTCAQHLVDDRAITLIQSTSEVL